jgi:hypothetical protein
VQLAGPGCPSSPSRTLASFTATSPLQPSPRRPTILSQMVPILTMLRRCTAIGGKIRLRSMHPGMPTSLAWRRGWGPMLSKSLPSSFLLQRTVHLRSTQLVVLNLTTTSRFAPLQITRLVSRLTFHIGATPGPCIPSARTPCRGA